MIGHFRPAVYQTTQIMRLLSLLGLLSLFFACNNQASVTADAREPVYYEEEEVITVPDPVAPTVTETQVPTMNGRAAKTERRITQAPLDKRDKAVLLRMPEEVDTRNNDRMAKHRANPPARVNRAALSTGNTTTAPGTTATAPTQSATIPAPSKPRSETRTRVATPTVAAPPAPTAPAEELIAYPNHEAFDALLRQYVNGRGEVNYTGLKSRTTALNDYLRQLENNAPDSSWPDAEVMAYWINAYNAYTLKLIVDNYPTQSIKDLKGGNPWDVKWINIGGQTYSLNNIEHDILRKRFDDARIHAVVNCAAASCPPLWNRAFTSGNLQKGLDTRTKNWINNPAYNKIDGSNVQLSKLFDWYGDDFGDKIDFLNRYYEGDRIPGSANVSYLDYDWALNEQ